MRNRYADRLNAWSMHVFRVQELLSDTEPKGKNKMKSRPFVGLAFAGCLSLSGCLQVE